MTIGLNAFVVWPSIDGSADETATKNMRTKLINKISRNERIEKAGKMCGIYF